jgi:hypothetical protein
MQNVPTIIYCFFYYLRSIAIRDVLDMLLSSDKSQCVDRYCTVVMPWIVLHFFCMINRWNLNLFSFFIRTKRLSTNDSMSIAISQELFTNNCSFLIATLKAEFNQSNHIETILGSNIQRLSIDYCSIQLLVEESVVTT